MSDNYAEQLAKGGLLITLLFVIGAVLGYGLRIFISRNLSVEEFGVFYSILSFVGIFSVFKELGFASSIVVKTSEFLELKNLGKIKTIIKKSLYIQVSASILISFFVWIFSGYFLNDISVITRTVLALILISFTVSVLYEIFRSVLQGTKKFVFYSAIEPIRLLLIFAVSGVAFFLGMGIVGLAFAYMIAAIVLSIAVPVYFFVKNREIVTSKAESVPKNDFLKFSGILWIGSLASTASTYADTILLALLKAPKEAGFYQVALPTAQLMTFFLTPITIVLLPFISEIWAKKDRNTINNAAGFSVKILLIMIIPAIIILESLSSDIIIFIFGEKFLPAIPALQILAVGMIFYSFVPIFITFLLGLGRPKDIVKIHILMGVVNVALDLVLIQYIGLIGAAISLSVSYFAGCFVSMYILRKQIKFTIQYKNTAKAIIGGIIVLGIVLMLKQVMQFTSVVEAVVLVIVSVVIYSAYIVFTKTIDKRDFKIVKNTKILPKFVENFIERFVRE